MRISDWSSDVCSSDLFLLGLGALLVVGNTVRLDIKSRREEISVLQLLGATDGFIRRPFLYLGAWYGIGDGAIALGLLSTAGHALRDPLAQLAARSGTIGHGSCRAEGGQDGEKWGVHVT